MSICPICGRPFGNPNLVDFHHLVPKTFKGKDGITLHRVCHEKLHSAITEREMLHYYHTIERLLEHEEIQKFIIWIKKKDVDFVVKHKETAHRHGKRRK